MIWHRYWELAQPRATPSIITKAYPSYHVLFPRVTWWIMFSLFTGQSMRYLKFPNAPNLSPPFLSAVDMVDRKLMSSSLQYRSWILCFCVYLITLFFHHFHHSVWVMRLFDRLHEIGVYLTDCMKYAFIWPIAWIHVRIYNEQWVNGSDRTQSESKHLFGWSQWN